MTWPTPYDHRRISLRVEGRISEADAARQERTAEEILARLADQPGLILADEVGMGKTFVALAVAASVALADRRRRPVVVMVPPSLKNKWPRDFETFRERCLDGGGGSSDKVLRCRTAATGVDFFRLMDDPATRRAHIIFLPHGALHRALTDPWTKLAILRKALSSHKLAAQRSVLPRFAGDILRCASRYREPLFEQLLSRPETQWRNIITIHADDPKDDPVPKAILQVLKRRRVDLKDLRDRLAELPLKHSKHIGDRLKNVRRSLNEAIREIWAAALVEARFRSPLLILDEAHHLKNPATRLASLFVAEEAAEDAKLLTGALARGFERMLFLTATPFELGHGELLSVLERFRAIEWDSGSSTMSLERFDESRERLAKSLNEAYFATHQLDQRWASLRPEHLPAYARGEEALEAWWSRAIAKPEEEPEAVQAAIRAHARAVTAMKSAEEALRPWIIRHTRPNCLPSCSILRRQLHRGAAILGEDERGGGLEIRDDALLPFLLAARSQAVVARRDRQGSGGGIARATFAEGLASSYEAFLHTRAGAMHRHGVTEAVVDDEPPMNGEAAAPLEGTVSWYLRHLHASLPEEAHYTEHPKIGATIRRACDLWERGEKTLIFCHWRATGDALARHLSSVLASRIARLGSSKLGLPTAAVDDTLRRLGDRFDKGGPLDRHLHDVVYGFTSDHPELTDPETDRIVDVVRRFVRTPAFLVRYFPLDQVDPTQAFISALQQSDQSGLSIREKLKSLIEFLAKRCEKELRGEYLEALEKMQTGLRYAGRTSKLSESEAHEIQPSVRRATGADDHEQRRKTLLGFNTPFYPEILVASSVLAEGVDLHLDCRHVIHHDLSWNPSLLEQRTGRVDRIGSKAERVGQSIQIFLPFVAETQDEKMYRVVQDRERWFQVLLGTEYVPDELVTDRISARIPLPEAAASSLVFRLDVAER